MMLILTLGGALLLMISGDALVRGAVGLSLKLGLSTALISLTVVALGTSAPELVISVEAALEGSPDIALGNVVGSNIANILLVIGIPVLVASLRTDGRETRRNYGLMLAATALFCVMAATGEIGRVSGLVLLAALIMALVYSYRMSGLEDSGDLDVQNTVQGWKMTALLLFGIVGLPIGAHMLIEGSRSIALSFGLSEAAIGLTVVALGTSLPELAASTAAAFRGRADIALGNVIGSNMLNLLAVLGVTAAISPLSVSRAFQTVDIPIMAAVTLLLAPFLIWKLPIGRAAGAAFIALYMIFVWVALGDVSI